jgi:hypothetical protein
MTTRTRSPLFALAAALVAMPALAQNGNEKASADQRAAAAAAKLESKDTTTAKPAASAITLYTPPIEIQHIRPNDLRGLNVFETPKNDAVAYTGFKLNWGAAFTQQFQNLGHTNSAAAKIVNGVNQNQLITIGGGFNNAVANLYLNAQLAPGIRVAVTNYLSARHHQETWVKDGYFLIEDSPIDVAPLKAIMQYVTLKVGHFELNYGDQHYRRTDNGNAFFNPLVGNLLMDAFTTEIGAEALVRKGPFLAMAGATAGETRGQVTVPEKRSPAFLGKVGFDQQVTPLVRVRLTGSAFSQSRSANQSLFSGDRGGGRYYLVMVNTAGTEKDSAWTGNIQPKISGPEQAWVINPFIKVGGLEFFGNIEQTQGRNLTETANRTWNQNAYELTYRFFDEKLYVAGRYNTVTGRLPGMTSDVSANRTNVGGGWFVTPNVMAKVEYMKQLYKDFPLSDIRNGGRIKGLMFEGVVSF